MPLPTDEKRLALAKDVIQAFDDLNGVHPGFRPAHAKGILVAGTFTPTPEAAQLSAAPHFQAETPVFVRFSNFAGIPTVADNKPDQASPRGCGIRFQLGEHKHTDIVAHSADGFPARTAEEFAQFLESGRSQRSERSASHAHRQQFLGSHPKALAFVVMPKPIPTSFAHESFFSVSAFKFINATGKEQFVRYRIVPEAGNDYLSEADLAAKGANFLMEELAARLATGPAKMQVWVQLAEAGDITDNAQEPWPADRKQVQLGTISLTRVVPQDDRDGSRIIFDPIPRVTGIEPSADPLLEPRADVYVMTGKRRREAKGV